jgi:XisH protein
MPQRDTYHETVRQTLIRDGWSITHDPYPLQYGESRLYVDLAAHGPLAAEKEGRKIAVEIKSFLGASEMADLERAPGQYVLYRFLLSREEPDRHLFLAVPRDTFETLLDTADGRDLTAAQALRVLVFDVIGETVVQWIE